MSKIILDEKYRTGHRQIDEQHAKLLEYLKNAVEGLKNKHGDGREGLLNLIQDIKVYAKIHLDYEEAQMLKEEYPDIKNHTILHDSFREKVLEVEKQAKYTHEELKKLATYIRDWFVNHILVEDKKFGDFLNKK